MADTVLEDIYCSFCGKSAKQVKMLIAGKDAFICGECNEILDEDRKSKG